MAKNYSNPDRFYAPNAKWRQAGRDFIREKIRQRDNHTCQHCKKVWEPGKRRFDVHHLDEVKDKTRQYDNYEEEKDNLITLCHKCHLNIPGHKKKMSEKAKEMRDIKKKEAEGLTGEELQRLSSAAAECGSNDITVMNNAVTDELLKIIAEDAAKPF